MHHKKRHNGKKQRERLEKFSLKRYRRHILLCIGSECCNGHDGKAAWKALKRAIKDHELSDGTILRTKVDCLGVCSAGPVAVVYPEGTWYSELHADRMSRFVCEHLVGGCPIAEWIFLQNRLSADSIFKPSP